MLTFDDSAFEESNKVLERNKNDVSDAESISFFMSVDNEKPTEDEEDTSVEIADEHPPVSNKTIQQSN